MYKRRYRCCCLHYCKLKASSKLRKYSYAPNFYYNKSKQSINIELNKDLNILEKQLGIKELKISDNTNTKWNKVKNLTDQVTTDEYFTLLGIFDKKIPSQIICIIRKLVQLKSENSENFNSEKIFMKFNNLNRCIKVVRHNYPIIKFFH